jgi:hypothetical protein
MKFVGPFPVKSKGLADEFLSSFGQKDAHHLLVRNDNKKNNRNSNSR